MPAFQQQLPALVGVVIGALGSHLALVRSDRERYKRDRAARWEQRRLAVYSEYARSLKKSVTLTYRVAAHRGNDLHWHPLPLAEAEPFLARATGGRDSAGEALIMLGSREVVDRAREWATW
jgi:hypothetical protein